MECEVCALSRKTQQQPHQQERTRTKLKIRAEPPRALGRITPLSSDRGVFPTGRDAPLGAVCGADKPSLMRDKGVATRNGLPKGERHQHKQVPSSPLAGLRTGGDGVAVWEGLKA